jgi:hypothetical protein
MNAKLFTIASRPTAVGPFGGVDAFLDPHRQEVVELPSGYEQVWANNLGEHILSESPSFNPNIHSNLHWEPMKKQ